MHHHHAARLILLIWRAPILFIAIVLILLMLTNANIFTVPIHQNMFVQQATSGNIEGDATVINDDMTNGRPDVILFVSQLWNPQGVGGIYNDHPIGVRYNSTEGRWAIFNEDLAPMQPDLAFNVVIGSTITHVQIYIHTSAEINGTDFTNLNDSATNGNPHALILATPGWNNNEVYDPHPIGVRYNPASGLWSIFNEDQAQMPANMSFNVLTASGPSSSFYTLTSSSANTGNDFTDTSDTLSANVNNHVFVTPNWNSNGGANGIYHNHNLGIWFDTYTHRFSVFNQDIAAMPYNISFNILVL